MFLLYINEFSNNPDINGQIISYADDTAILFKAESWEEVYRLTEKEMKRIQEWLNINLLSLNIEKTKFITFSSTTHDQPNTSSIKIHKANSHTSNNKMYRNSAKCSCPYIEKVNSIKYLGVKLDQHLRWKDNIEYIYNRLRGLIPKFYNIRDILSQKNLHVVYSALAESVMRYCILVWGGVFQESLKNLNIIQNTLLKILFKKDRTHSTEMLYAEVGVLNIRQLYTSRCLMWMFEIRDSWDTSTSVVHNTRCAQHLEAPFFG